MPIYPGRRKGTWRVTIYCQGRQHEWIVEGPKKDAKLLEETEHAKLRVRSVAQARAVPTFSTFCLEQYTPHALVHLGARTWNLSRRFLVAILCKHLGGLRLDQFAPEYIDDFKRIRKLEANRKTGRARKSSGINTELQVLRTILNWARKDRGQPVPIFEITPLSEAHPRTLAWSADEVKRLYAACRRHRNLLPLVMFLLNTGCRKGEAIAAEWTWIDWDARMLRIPVTEWWQPKDGEPREVPVSDVLVAMLKTLPRVSDRHVFASRFGTPFEKFPETMVWAIREAGLRGGPHTARHTFASHFLARKPDLLILGRIMGHSAQTMTERYAHMLPGQLEGARNVVNLAPSGQKLWRTPLAKQAK
jgi:integrase